MLSTDMLQQPSFFESSQSTNSEKVIYLINCATLADTEQDKLNALKEAQDVVINKDPALLDIFFNDILAFQADPSIEVKKCVISFIEEACKKNPQNLGKVMGHINIYLRDANPLFQKRIIQIITTIYKVFLAWVTKSDNQSTINDMTHQIWIFLKNIKSYVLNMIESDNDGVRTQVIKFMEAVVLAQSSKSADSFSAKTSTFSLDDVPERHKFLRYLQLQEESKQILTSMVKLCASMTISHSNLNTLIGSLTDIALQRPQYMGKIVATFITLYNNLPPTLAKSQVTSVKKGLKNRFINLVKHPSSIEYQSQIVPILIELGLSQTEISRCLYKFAKLSSTTNLEIGQKFKIEEGKANLNLATDISNAETKKYLDALTTENVVGLVLDNLLKVPDIIPPTFVQNYHAISKAGSETHKLQLAQLLSNLVNQAQNDKLKEALDSKTYAKSTIDASMVKGGIKATLGGGEKTAHLLEEQMERLFSSKLRKSLQQSQGQTQVSDFDVVKRSSRLRQCLRSFASVNGASGSSEVSMADLANPENYAAQHAKAKILDNFDASVQCKNAVFRILFNSPTNERYPLKYKIDLLTNVISFKDVLLATQNVAKTEFEKHASKSKFSAEILDFLVASILSDLTAQIDLALVVLGKIYREGLALDLTSCAKYEQLFIEFARQCVKDENAHCLTRLVTEAPIITTFIIDEFFGFITEAIDAEDDPGRQSAPATSIANMLFPVCAKMADTRPAVRNEVLSKIFFAAMTHSSDLDLRKLALDFVMQKLYDTKNYAVIMEKFALQQIAQLKSPHPPEVLLDPRQHNSKSIGNTPKDIKIESRIQLTWTDELIKICLHFFLILLPKNHKLTTALVDVYVQANADIKRVILKSLEMPIRLMGGVDSEELMAVVKSCPKGAETLVTRLVYVMATPDLLHTAPAGPISNAGRKGPSSTLVNAVRNLYYNKKLITDVRILIPIVAGLTRDEVIGLLPKFLALTNISLVKEVITKLCSGLNPILSPSELLVALHMIPAIVSTSKIPSTSTTPLDGESPVPLVSVEEEAANCDTKALIRAINLCFATKRLFNAETVCIAIESLLEVVPLPLLFMRTVVQAIVQYPHLLPFITEVLIRLIEKRIWEQEKQTWLGFVKCCQKITQHALPILTKLPVTALADFLAIAPEFKEPLHEYVEGLQQAGRGSDIPSPLLNYVLSKYANASNLDDDDFSATPVTAAKTDTIDTQDDDAMTLDQSLVASREHLQPTPIDDDMESENF